VSRYSSESILSGIAESPRRVISLVPSITESLYAFGLGENVIGITDYCPQHLDERIKPIRLGGTKTTAVEKIIDMKPDLVLGNQEENSRDAMNILEEAGVDLWLTFPKTIDEAIGDLWTMVRLFHKERDLTPHITTLERSLQWTRIASSDKPGVRFFCPIWKGESQDWWMTFNRHTYANDILSCCGGENVFAERERRYPLEADLGLEPAGDALDRDTRYPRVTVAEIISAAPDLILLPSEPHAFDARDGERIRELFSYTPAVAEGKIHFVDGRLIAWHGIRMAEALAKLPGIFQQGIA
jgi:iron complex transport system substrate-binding protein